MNSQPSTIPVPVKVSPALVGMNEDRGDESQQFNRMDGTPEDLKKLQSFANYKSDDPRVVANRQKLLNQNRGFYTWIMLNVAAKNKLDYPPFGPSDPNKKAFQDYKLKCLFKAISEKSTSETGALVDSPLGSHGVGQQYVAAARGLGSQFANMGRGIARIPSSGISSVGTSIKNMFGKDARQAGIDNTNKSVSSWTNYAFGSKKGGRCSKKMRASRKSRKSRKVTRKYRK
jgi:hypothetical protein